MVQSKYTLASSLWAVRTFTTPSMLRQGNLTWRVYGAAIVNNSNSHERLAVCCRRLIIEMSGSFPLGQPFVIV